MSWASRSAPIKVGDKVCYSARFLRSIGCFSGDLPQASGEVTALERVGEIILAVVDWADDDIPPKVNVNNLVRVAQRGACD